MEESKFIVVNLSGVLNKDLIDNLLKRLEGILEKPSILVLDMFGVVSYDRDGLNGLKKSIDKITMARAPFAIASVKDELKPEFNLAFRGQLRFFDTKEQAKEYLESQDNNAETSPRSNFLPEITQFTLKENLYYVYCIGCGVKLRIRAKGNHACPNCKTKFQFNPDPVLVTKYEILSLE